MILQMAGAALAIYVLRDTYRKTLQFPSTILCRQLEKLYSLQVSCGSIQSFLKVALHCITNCQATANKFSYSFNLLT